MSSQENLTPNDTKILRFAETEARAGRVESALKLVHQVLDQTGANPDKKKAYADELAKAGILTDFAIEALHEKMSKEKIGSVTQPDIRAFASDNPDNFDRALYGQADAAFNDVYYPFGNYWFGSHYLHQSSMDEELQSLSSQHEGERKAKNLISSIMQPGADGKTLFDKLADPEGRLTLRSIRAALKDGHLLAEDERTVAQNLGNHFGDVRAFANPVRGRYMGYGELSVTKATIGQYLQNHAQGDYATSDGPSETMIGTSQVSKDTYNKYQMDLCKKIVDALLKGNGSNSKGDLNDAEKEYQLASDLAAKVNIPYIATHQDELGKTKNEPGLDLKDACALVQATNSHQAQMLLDHGKYEEALPLMAKLLANAPDLAQDKNFQLRMAEAMGGASSLNDDREEHVKKFYDAYFAKENQDPNEDQEHRRQRFTTALNELNEAEKTIKAESAQMTKGLGALKTSQKELEFERADLDRRANLEQKEKEFELIRINNEIDSTKKAIDALNVGVEIDRQSLADVAYWQGSTYVQLGPDYRAQAHEKFEFAKENGTRFAKDPKWQLDNNLGSTTWWAAQQDGFKRAAVFVSAVAAGVAVGVLTLETGPGALIAGSATTAAIIDGTILIGGGALAGSLASVGASEVLEVPVTGATWVKGAGLGGGAAFFFFSAVGAAPAVVATATEAEGLTSAASALEAQSAVEGVSGEVQASLLAEAQNMRRLAQAAKWGTRLTRLRAGVTAGAAFGTIDGAANFYNSTHYGNMSTEDALKDYCGDILFGAGFGAFTPLRSFRMMQSIAHSWTSGESALANAWREAAANQAGFGGVRYTVGRLGTGLGASYPVLIGPPIEGEVVQSAESEVVQLLPPPPLPQPEAPPPPKHDYSTDKDVIEE
jgi:hypothetical protein